MDPDPQDSLVTSSEDVIQIEKEILSGRFLPLAENRDVLKKKTKAVNDKFPWLSSFQKLSRSLVGNSSIKSLLNLITIYTEHVSRDVTASYPKPNRAAKLKQSMINMIGLFHSCYININAPLDEGIYMDKMSNLLTMYMDMELKASRRAKESVQKVASKVVSSLFIILNNSPEYILDTILNARFITVKKFREICIPIFKKVTSDLQPHQDMTYVRCLIIFKLWKRLVARGKERNSLNRLAVAKLSPPPPQLLEMIQRGLLVKVLPNLPPNKDPELVTRFYLLAKFNLRDSIKALMKLKADLQLTELSTSLSSSRFFEDPFNQENFIFSDDTLNEKAILQDCSIMDSVWTYCSDFSSTNSDSASLDNIICDDSPNSSKKNRVSRYKKTNKNKEIPKRMKENANNKEGVNQIMSETKPSSPKDDGFLNFQIVEFQKIKLTSYHGNDDQNSNKPSPSSTVNDDCVIVSDTQTNSTFDHQVSKVNKIDENDDSICNATINKFDPNSITLNLNNESVIKKEIEHETPLICQKTSVSTYENKHLEISNSRQLENSNIFPNLKENHKKVDGNHTKPTVPKDISQDDGLKSVQISIKNELKLNSCDSVSSIKDMDSTSIETNKFNNETTDIGNLKLFESTNISEQSSSMSDCTDKSSTMSDCTEKNKSTQNVELLQFSLKNDHASSAIICDVIKQKNLDYVKTGFDQMCDDVSKNSVTNTGSLSSKSDLKVEPLLPKITSVEDKVLGNNSPDTEIEIPKVKIRGFSVLSYIPKSGCDLQTTKTTLLDQFESPIKSQVVIKSEKENRNILRENTNTSCTLYVKKEFNCKKDDVPINSSKSNILQKNEEINNQIQNCNTGVLPKSQECVKNTCFKQISKNDLNACLLHNIIEEDDCLKNCSNECLLRKPKSSKETFLIDDSKNHQMKNILNYSEPKSSNYTSIDDWNDSAAIIKKEKEFDSKSVNYMFCENKSSLNFNPEISNCNKDKFINNNLESLPTETALNKLHYQLTGSLSDPNTANTDYYYESEDSNLVIDEDVVDPFKDQTENVVEDPCLVVKSISDSSYSKELKNNFKESKATKESSFNDLLPAVVNETYKDVIEPDILSKMRNQDLSVCEKNIVQNKLASTHLFVKDHFEKSVQNNPNSKNNLLPEKAFSQLSTLKFETSQLGITNHVHEQCRPPSKLKQKKGLEYQQAKLSSNPNMDSNLLLSQKKITPCHPVISENNPVFVSKANATTSFNQTQQINLLMSDSFSSVNEPSPPINVLPVNQTLPDTQHLRKYTQPTSGGVLLDSKKTITHMGISSQVNSAGNKFPNLNKKNEAHKRVNSSSPKSEIILKHFTGEMSSITPSVQSVQNGTENYLSNNVRCCRGYSKTCEPLEVSLMKLNDNITNKSDSVLDPLCKGQKTVADSRDIVDFEFNVFPVAHEVEVCSASDPMSVELACQGSSEIGHPDWPIANEQSVIDSSNYGTYSGTSDQYLYASNIISDQCYTVSEMNQSSSVSTLELQQVAVDFRYPSNTTNYVDKDKFNLHFKTMEVDYNLCCSQRKFKEFYLSQDVPPAIPAPFPPHGHLDNMKTSVRCGCEQCSDNHQVLLNNYNILTQFRNSRLRPLSIYSMSIDNSLTDQNCDSDCSLPLKKRKTLTNSKSNEEPTLMSYPNTPMISIAQLELAGFEQQNQMVHQGHWKDVSQYNVEAHNPLNLAHYSSAQQTNLASQTKTSKTKSTKRRKSSRLQMLVNQMRKMRLHKALLHFLSQPLQRTTLVP